MNCGPWKESQKGERIKDSNFKRLNMLSCKQDQHV